MREPNCDFLLLHLIWLAIISKKKELLAASLWDFFGRAGCLQLKLGHSFHQPLVGSFVMSWIGHLETDKFFPTWFIKKCLCWLLVFIHILSLSYWLMKYCNCFWNSWVSTMPMFIWFPCAGVFCFFFLLFFFWRGWGVVFFFTVIIEQSCTKAGSRVAWAGLKSQEGRNNWVWMGFGVLLDTCCLAHSESRLKESEVEKEPE